MVLFYFQSPLPRYIWPHKGPWRSAESRSSPGWKSSIVVFILSEQIFSIASNETFSFFGYICFNFRKGNIEVLILMTPFQLHFYTSFLWIAWVAISLWSRGPCPGLNTGTTTPCKTKLQAAMILNFYLLQADGFDGGGPAWDQNPVLKSAQNGRLIVRIDVGHLK